MLQIYNLFCFKYVLIDSLIFFIDSCSFNSFLVN